MSNIEDHIRRAMEEGKFDDLPGKGKPLKLEDDPFADPEWRLAHHMLRSSGFTLPWIERRQEIEASLETARMALQRSAAWRQASLANQDVSPAFVQVEWQKAIDLFLERVRAINQDIRSYNLEVPSERFQLRPVNGPRELDLISSGASGTLRHTSPGL
jgi:DnaJ family protein C protein 28